MTTSNWFKVQTISQTQRGKLSCPFHSHSYIFRIKSKFFNVASVIMPRFCCACHLLLKSLKCLPLLSPHSPGFARIGCTKRLFRTLGTFILDLWLFRLTKVIFFFTDESPRLQEDQEVRWSSVLKPVDSVDSLTNVTFTQHLWLLLIHLRSYGVDWQSRVTWGNQLLSFYMDLFGYLPWASLEMLEDGCTAFPVPAPKPKWLWHTYGKIM